MVLAASTSTVCWQEWVAGVAEAGVSGWWNPMTTLSGPVMHRQQRHRPYDHLLASAAEVRRFLDSLHHSNFCSFSFSYGTVLHVKPIVSEVTIVLRIPIFVWRLMISAVNKYTANIALLLKMFASKYLCVRFTGRGMTNGWRWHSTPGHCMHQTHSRHWQVPLPFD